MKQVFFSIETTGMSLDHGARIVEIAAMGAQDSALTGRRLHAYLIPRPPLPFDTPAENGVSDNRLSFDQIFDKLRLFISGATVWIHDAPFVTRFLNMELARIGKPPIESMVESVVDTLPMFRALFPGRRFNLEQICEHLCISLPDTGENAMTSVIRLVCACFSVWERLDRAWKPPTGMDVERYLDLQHQLLAKPTLPENFNMGYLQRHHKLSYRNAVALMNQLVVSGVVALNGTDRGLGYVRGPRSSNDGRLRAWRDEEGDREREVLSKLALAGEEIAARAREPAPNLPTAKILDDAASEIFRIGMEELPQNLKTVEVLVSSVLDQVDDAMLNDPDGLSTGIPELDRLTGGFQPGELIVLAARPGFGKTALALDIASHVALSTHAPVAYFSLKQTGQQLAARLVASVSGIDLQMLLAGRISNDERERLADAATRLASAKLFMGGASCLTVGAIHVALRQLVPNHDLWGLIVVDDIQSMTDLTGSGGEQLNMLAESAQRLSLIARAFCCPVLALSEVNDAVDTRWNKRPLLMDIVGARAIVPHADSVYFLYSDLHYNPESKDAGITEIIVAKQKAGLNGTIRLAFNPS